MNALIGYTGFIGSNLCKQFDIDLFYNSSNIETIKGETIDHLICAGLPGVKWLANKNPKEDLKKINLLKSSIKDLKVNQVTFISSIDVYKNPVQVDEDTKTSLVHHAYGAHRTEFENFMISNFKNIRSLRLPVVYGSGFKKNYLYDLINDNNIEKICLDSEVQFYHVKNLKKDIEKAWKINSKIINLAVEPVLIFDIVEKYFLDKKSFCVNKNLFKTDMKTKFSKTGYFYNKKETLKLIGEFLK